MKIGKAPSQSDATSFSRRFSEKQEVRRLVDEAAELVLGAADNDDRDQRRWDVPPPTEPRSSNCLVGPDRRRNRCGDHKVDDGEISKIRTIVSFFERLDSGHIGTPFGPLGRLAAERCIKISPLHSLQLLLEFSGRSNKPTKPTSSMRYTGGVCTSFLTWECPDMALRGRCAGLGQYPGVDAERTSASPTRTLDFDDPA